MNINLPKPSNCKDPIQLIINGDNTGLQLLTENMLNDYWRDKIIGQSSIVSLAEPTSNSTGVMVIEEKKAPSNVKLVTCGIPDIIQKRPMSKFPPSKPEKRVFQTRILRKFDSIQNDDRSNLKLYKQKYEDWLKNKAKNIQNTDIFERHEEELDDELNFQQKMLKLGFKNIIVYNSANIGEIRNTRNVQFENLE